MKEKVISMAIMLVVLTSLSMGLGEKGWGNVKGLINTGYEEMQKLGHNLYVLSVYQRGHEVIYEDIRQLILMNPPIDKNTLLADFTKMIFPFYVLAIVGTGFYLLFLSGSPARGSKAKAMFSKLVFGMIVISIAPKILEVIMALSAYLTAEILDLMPMSAYLAVIMEFSENFSALFLFVEQLNLELGFIYPGIWIWYLFWGTFFVFILRYILLVLFIALLPVIIFLYSFDITKALGRTMIESLILWIGIQAFIASVVIAVVLCMNSGFGEAFNISGFGNFLLFTGAGFIVLGPFLMTRIFRNFIPG